MSKQTKAIKKGVTQPELDAKLRKALRAVEILKRRIVEKNEQSRLNGGKQVMRNTELCNLLFGYISTQKGYSTAEELFNYLRGHHKGDKPLRPRAISNYISLFRELNLITEVALNDKKGTIGYFPSIGKKNTVLEICKRCRNISQHEDKQSLIALRSSIEDNSQHKIIGHPICIFTECIGDTCKNLKKQEKWQKKKEHNELH